MSLPIAKHGMSSIAAIKARETGFKLNFYWALLIKFSLDISRTSIVTSFCWLVLLLSLHVALKLSLLIFFSWSSFSASLLIEMEFSIFINSLWYLHQKSKYLGIWLTVIYWHIISFNFVINFQTGETIFVWDLRRHNEYLLLFFSSCCCL